MASAKKETSGLGSFYDYKTRISKPAVDLSALTSIFFTDWQYALLQEARRGYVTTPPPPEAAPESPAVVDAPVASGGAGKAVRRVRELSLGGIIFKDSGNWTIWLNRQRVTPKDMPEQVVSIKVSEQYIDLKWRDSATDKVYPIRLRPHQRFDLDSRSFLTGANGP